MTPQRLQQAARTQPPSPPDEWSDWVRLPKRGLLDGFSRPALYELIKKNQIRTASVPVHGIKRGIRLIHRPSLRALIESHATGPDLSKGTGGEP